MRRYFWTLLLFGCSTRPIFERGALVEWELRARPGYNSLVSQRCLTWQGERCAQLEVFQFDLAKSEDRDRLRAARFVCRVDAWPMPVWGICKEQPGLCQYRWVSGGFLGLGKEKKLINFLDFTERFQYLVDKGTRCLSLDNPLSDEL